MKRIVLQFILCSFFGIITQAQNTAYVSCTATGLNDGSSWTNAYLSITTAVNEAGAGDTILVKAGEYKEMVTLDKALHIYGGFSGNENYSTESDPLANRVILNADVNGDDIQGSIDQRVDNYNYLMNIDGASEGTFHIVGLTFFNGFNNGVFNSSRGGALIIRNGYLGNPDSPKSIEVNIQKCLFDQNYCNGEGGAIYTGSTLPGNHVITNIDKCEFFYNASLGSRGAAIFNYAYGGPQAVAALKVSNSVFHSNVDYMTDFPAVIYNASSSYAGNAFAHIINNTFVDNYAGAVFNYHGGSGTNTVASLLFKNNIIDNEITSYAPLYIGNQATASGFYQVLIDHNCFTGTIQNNVNAGVVVSNTIASSPMFVGGIDFRLQENSPCVNAGDTSNISLTYIDTLDFQDSSRFQGIVDLGAYEYQFPAEEPEDTTNSASILSMHLNLDIEMYPNPASDHIQINLPQQEKVQIYDLQGNLLMTSEPALTHTINIQKLASGVYIMKSVNSSLRFIKIQ
jgi:trimeric autotransporter adhesin